MFFFFFLFFFPFLFIFLLNKIMSCRSACYGVVDYFFSFSHDLSCSILESRSYWEKLANFNTTKRIGVF